MLLLVLLVASLLDGVLTVIGQHYFHATEANPVAAYLLEFGLLPFLVGKTFIHVGIVYAFYKGWKLIEERKWLLNMLRFVTALYVLVAVYHVVLFLIHLQ